MPKTDLKRDILIAAKNNPGASNAELADIAGCSESYVSNVLSEYDDYTQIDAIDDELERDLDKLDDHL